VPGFSHCIGRAAAAEWRMDRHRMSVPNIEVEPLGDSALLLRLGEQIDESIQRRIHAICIRLESRMAAGAIEIVPAFTTVAVHYDPRHLGYAALAAEVLALTQNLDEEPVGPARVVTIPVRYGGEGGPDLEYVAKRAGLSIDQVVALHTRADYLVHMIGFAPGFPYLGGLDARIACPRRDIPRPRVPAGSVGIGGNQTGIYPIESPGGWQIIGRTTLKLFDAERDPAALLRPGDRVRFAKSES
jgi:inhibitor of KinA